MNRPVDFSVFFASDQHSTATSSSSPPPHQSRKIRCSGETDTGCTACRGRGQPCLYEPTAAMGRPRKYPRTEGGGHSPTAHEHLQSHQLPPHNMVTNLQSVWDDPPTTFLHSIQNTDGFTLTNNVIPYTLGTTMGEFKPMFSMCFFYDQALRLCVFWK